MTDRTQESNICYSYSDCYITSNNSKPDAAGVGVKNALEYIFIL